MNPRFAWLIVVAIVTSGSGYACTNSRVSCSQVRTEQAQGLNSDQIATSLGTSNEDVQKCIAALPAPKVVAGGTTTNYNPNQPPIPAIPVANLPLSLGIPSLGGLGGLSGR